MSLLGTAYLPWKQVFIYISGCVVLIQTLIIGAFQSSFACSFKLIKCKILIDLYSMLQNRITEFSVSL